MWRNVEVAGLVDWLREHNDAQPAGAAKAGLYGLDLYSLHTSMEAVVEYLEEIDPGAARRARERYACFDQFGRDPQVYAYEAGIAGAEPCEQQAVDQLVDLRRAAAELAAANAHVDPDAHFFAERNAQLVVDAERYYRAMFRGGIESWNLTAASDWGGAAERKHVRRALPGSWEELFHERGVPRFVLDGASLRGRRLERAIGVVYRPETERISHYFHARLSDQFDVVVHVDETSAVEPLERTGVWEEGELPETYPWGV
jgi:erythromycin esterase-like protein